MGGSSWRRRPLPADWSRLRKACFVRDGYRCVYVLNDGSRCEGRDVECDHIDENLQSLCSYHHALKTQEFARRMYRKRMAEVRSRFARTEFHPGRVGW